MAEKCQKKSSRRIFFCHTLYRNVAIFSLSVEKDHLKSPKIAIVSLTIKKQDDKSKGVRIIHGSP